MIIKLHLLPHSPSASCLCLTWWALRFLLLPSGLATLVDSQPSGTVNSKSLLQVSLVMVLYCNNRKASRQARGSQRHRFNSLSLILVWGQSSVRNYELKGLECLTSILKILFRNLERWDIGKYLDLLNAFPHSMRLYSAFSIRLVWAVNKINEEKCLPCKDCS